MSSMRYWGLSMLRGAPPLPEGAFIHESETLGLYLYPAELDYRRERPLSAS